MSASVAGSSPAKEIVAKGIDFNSDAFIENPYATYARLRSEEPVCRIEALNAWLITRYQDVKTSLLNETLFRIDFERLQTNRMGPGVVDEPFYNFGKEFIAFADRPHHYDLKKFLMGTFTRSHAERYMPRMRQLANEAIDGFIADREVELMARYAHAVPLGIISDLLGIPPEDRRLMEQWVQGYSPVIGFPPMSDEQLRLANEASHGFDAYFDAMIARRRGSGGDDLISQLVAANDARAEPFDQRQLIANFILLYFAGQDTQKGHFGSVLLNLHQHPDQLDWLRQDPARVWEAANELMRYDSVSQVTARVASADTEIAGMKIAAGQTILFGIGAANRDPEVFEDPDRFDLQRADARSALTFGAGPHACLGTHFARMLMAIMLETLLTRIPSLEVQIDRVVRNKTLSKRSFASMPARW